MENGSGGFMSNLTFVGGNFGCVLLSGVLLQFPTECLPSAQ
jgi:hypothetical protein